MHAKLFGGWNAAVTDPWDVDVVYFIDAEAEAVHQVVDKTGDGKRPDVAEVWAAPEPSQTPGRYAAFKKAGFIHCSLWMKGKGPSKDCTNNKNKTWLKKDKCSIFFWQFLHETVPS